MNLAVDDAVAYFGVVGVDGAFVADVLLAGVIVADALVCFVGQHDCSSLPLHMLDQPDSFLLLRLNRRLGHHRQLLNNE